ncbi:MAG: prephenate dehydrogenase [Planctomycetes bacterium]|nr:prephenate dehydrogenase [Planctomycetota bacterium]
MNIDGIRQVAIIGVGLLGGSLGLAIKRLSRRIKVVGVGRRMASLSRALEAGAIDRACMDLAQAVPESDLVVLATPVGTFGKYLRAVRPLLKAGALVTDVGSAKAGVVVTASRILGPAGPFVGSHPMAGSERKGSSNARADLFDAAVCIVTPTPKTPQTAVGRIGRFWRALGMKVVRMTPAGHDRAVAAVSHLPHLLSCLLMLLPDKAQLSLAAGGFRDMTRLAGGDHEMWRDILLANRPNILAAMARFDKDMRILRNLLKSADARAIEKFLTAARTRRDRAIFSMPRSPEA